jgi:formiminoglutamate deiminase
MTTYWCERAWLGDRGWVDGVTVEVDGPVISGVEQRPLPPHAHRLCGLTVPGFANCHSHAFHRALRGRSERGRGDFWTWREMMYDVADRLEPDNYYRLALATYQEMVLAGFTAVGEFHYLHRDSHGNEYADRNVFGHALIQAARDAGLRITLLDACYLSAGFGEPPHGVQQRFSDRTAVAWRERVQELADEQAGPEVVIGAAVHSVRAVPSADIGTVATALPNAPLHVHLSEQVAENTACLQRHGCTPTQLLAVEGALTDRLTAVHATHVTGEDVRSLGAARCFVAFCPTTERDLADGIGPSRRLAEAGARVTLGSDSQAVIDPFEEMRALEMDERLASGERGGWSAGELLTAGTETGHTSLGFAAGRIAVGEWADLVTLDVTSPRTAGTGGDAETVVYGASRADVTSVIASGRPVDLDPREVGAALAAAITAVTG